MCEVLDKEGLQNSVLKIRRGYRDNLGLIFHKNLCCDPSLEMSCQDGSNKGSQHMFLLRNKKKYLRIILNTPSYLEL